MGDASRIAFGPKIVGVMASIVVEFPKGRRVTRHLCEQGVVDRIISDHLGSVRLVVKGE